MWNKITVTYILRSYFDTTVILLLVHLSSSDVKNFMMEGINIAAPIWVSCREEGKFGTITWWGPSIVSKTPTSTSPLSMTLWDRIFKDCDPLEHKLYLVRYPVGNVEIVVTMRCYTLLLSVKAIIPNLGKVLLGFHWFISLHISSLSFQGIET